MARMSIDDSLARDPRLDDLAELVGWTRRETAGCLQMDVWPLCYDRVTPNIRPRDINIAANREAVTPVKHPGGFAAAMVEAGLGRPAVASDAFFVWEKNDGSRVKLPWRDAEWRERVYVVGAPERIAYLLKREESGKVGGAKSAESRRNKAKQTSSTASSSASSSASSGASTTASISASTSSNPSASASASALPSASPPVPDSEKENTATPPAVGLSLVPPPIAPRRRAKKPRQFTPQQREVAARVLAKLGETNGIRYEGSDKHVGLIVDRLADGLHELELRAIIAHCASPKASGGRGWEGDVNMRQHLSPETLFGPESHTKYLDPARAQYRDELAKQIGQPRLGLVEGT